jgi:hypothetical protein
LCKFMLGLMPHFQRTVTVSMIEFDWVAVAGSHGPTHIFVTGLHSPHIE